MSSTLSTMCSVTLCLASFSASYSSSPSSQTTSSVFCPREKLSSSIMLWISVVLPLSRKPATI